eukprot:GGOE01000981.1.p1 GENE.GGOE01000981.1~~GGOE01000981.1.p1  ORF type:complete len:709 (+),score=192.16 GGOE01000981.1:151-2277(+)
MNLSGDLIGPTSPLTECPKGRLEVGFSLNSLDASPDGRYVVVAGREVFKVIDAEDYTTLKEHANLRINTKTSNLFHISDAKWNPINAARIATATWNAQVVIWDLQKKGSKFLEAYDDHKRTVNKVSWRPQNPDILVSGAQDGLIKLWDLRQHASVQTFNDNCSGSMSGDAVRDVRFSPHDSALLAAGMDSGFVRVWDLRKLVALSPTLSINAHNNAPVRSLAWHPVQRELLASGSRDETVVVWDINRAQDGRNGTEAGSRFTIQTIAPVAVVLWRPVLLGRDNTAELVTAASTSHDLSIHMWDLFRPHIPVYSTKGHNREVTDVLWWPSSPDILLSVSKDGFLLANRFETSNVATVPGTCLSWSVDNTLAVVADKVDRTGLLSCAAQPSLQDWQRHARHRRVPQPLNVNGTIMMMQEVLSDEGPEIALDPFGQLARDYRLHTTATEGIAVICAHNAEAALRAQQDHLHDIWLILALWYRQEPDPNALVLGSLDLGRLQAVAAVSPPTSAHQTPRTRSARDPNETNSPCRRAQPQLTPFDEPDDSLALPRVPIDVSIRELLEFSCEEGDVQTCCTITTVLGGEVLALGVDPERATAWFLAYIDLLHQRQLFVIAADLIKHCPFPKVSSISTRGTNVSAACAACNLEVRPNHSRCTQCAKRLYVCAICNQEARGLVLWNWACGHGGHSHHMRDWFAKHRHCPKCGVEAHL